MASKKSLEDHLEDIKKVHSGKILSISCLNYRNNTSEVNVVCSNGHSFNSTIQNIKRGKFCPKCANNYHYTWEEYKYRLLKKFEGRIESVDCDKFRNCYSKVGVTCSNGHNFKTRITNLLAGDFCKTCTYNKISKDTSKSWADCLDLILKKHSPAIKSITCDDYKNGKSKPVVVCSNGHTFSNTTVSSLISGHFCPICSFTGYNPLLSGYLYINYVEGGEYYKVGITKNYKKRLQQQNRKNTLQSHLHKLFYCDDGLKIYEVEKEIKKSVTMSVISRDLFADGFTETFHKSDLSTVLGIIKDYSLKEEIF